MNVILRRSCLGGLGLVVCALGVGQAQQVPPKALRDILGTWRFEFGERDDSPGFGRLVDRTLTFRSDSVLLETLRRSFDADTLACTTKLRYRLSSDTVHLWQWWQDPQATRITMGSQIFTANDTLQFVRRSPTVLQAQQLVFRWYTDSPFSRIALATTLASDHIVPRSALPVPGKAAAVVGTWERVPGKGSDETKPGLVRSTLTVWPDLRYVTSTTWKDGVDTFTCTEEAQWRDMTDTLRLAGDTLFLWQGDLTGKLLLQGEELLFFHGRLDGQPPYHLRQVYKRVSRVPQP